MPFRLTNSPSTFRSIAKTLFVDLDYVWVYFDSVCIGSRGIEEHTNHLIVGLNRITGKGLKIKPNKCVFPVPRLEVLWYIISEPGAVPEPDRIKGFSEERLPPLKKELWLFLMFCSLNRRFVLDSSHITAPFHDLATQKSALVWNEGAKDCFYALKVSMSKLRTLVFPDADKTFFTSRDTSEYVLDAVLAQNNDYEKLVSVQLATRSLTKSRRMYRTLEKDALAVVFEVK